MADFQYVAIQVGGVDVAEINEYTISVKNNGEQQVGAGVLLGVSDGVTIVDLKVMSVCPVRGHSLDLLALQVSKQEFTVGFRYNDRAYTAPYKITEGQIKSTSKSGATTGDWTFLNGGPLTSVS